MDVSVVSARAGAAWSPETKLHSTATAISFCIEGLLDKHVFFFLEAYPFLKG